MLKKKIIPVFLASVLVISGTAGFSAGIVSENVYASEEAHTQRLSDFAIKIKRMLTDFCKLYGLWHIEICDLPAVLSMNIVRMLAYYRDTKQSIH